MNFRKFMPIIAVLWFAACVFRPEGERVESDSMTLCSTTGAGGGSVSSDTCASAEIIDATLGQTEIVDCTTTEAHDDFDPFCAHGAAAPDLVYQVNVPSAGTIAFVLNDASGGAPFNGALLVRSACGARSDSDLCENVNHGAGSGESLRYAIAPGTYFLVVDGGSAGAAGSFQLSVDLEPAACGDGVVNPGEECDAGSSQTDPTCYGSSDPAGCTLKPVPVSELETCPGQDVAIALNQHLVLGPNNTGNYHDNAIGSCALTNVGGRDQVFNVRPTASGTLTLKTGYDATASEAPFCNEGSCWPSFASCLPGCWTKVLYVRSACSNAATEIACDTDENLTKYLTADLAIPVTAGVNYYVFVDSISDNAYGWAAGPYYLYATLAP